MKPDSSLSLSFDMSVPEAVGKERPELVRSNVLIVQEESLMTPHGTGAVSGVMEIASGNSESGSTCTSTHSDSSTVLNLYKWGNSTLLATTTVSAGILGNATDGSGRQSFFLPFSFDDVASSHSVYTVAKGPDYGDGPCRACVIGFVTSTKYADEVFVDHT